MWELPFLSYFNTLSHVNQLGLESIRLSLRECIGMVRIGRWNRALELTFSASGILYYIYLFGAWKGLVDWQANANGQYYRWSLYLWYIPFQWVSQKKSRMDADALTSDRRCMPICYQGIITLRLPFDLLTSPIQYNACLALSLIEPSFLRYLQRGGQDNGQG